MGNRLHIKSRKTQCLTKMLSKIDKRRYHTLHLCSCYFSEDAARRLIGKVQEFAHLSAVNIYIDRKTAIEYGGDHLQEFCDSFNTLEVRINAVESTGLFHSKTYALIAFDEDGNVISGSIVLGSANLTGAGLISRGGNFECLIDSQDIELLEEHLSQLKKMTVLPPQELNKFSRKQEFSFKYALLQSGMFLHKWNENLEKELSIRYRLSESGKYRITDQSLEIVGFNIETATVSKRYFRFDYNPKHLDETKNLTRNFGIETYLGYWLPYTVLESMFDVGELDIFKEHLFLEIGKQRSEIEKKIQQDFDYLLQENLIEKIEINPVDSFNKKVENLTNNDLKLKRIYSKYELFYLPYDIQQKDEILEVFDEMIGFIESRKQKNRAMKAFLESYAAFSIERFDKLIEESMS